jgi:hypothetical protein
MSTLNTAKVQVGQSGTASQNFTLLQANDGTMSITRGNAGAPISVPFKINADNSIDGNMGVGAGQNWQTVTGSRALSTTYTNSTGRTIMVAITTETSSGTGQALGITVAGVLIIDDRTTAGASQTATFPVPAGATYSAASNKTLRLWTEMR